MLGREVLGNCKGTQTSADSCLRSLWTKPVATVSLVSYWDLPRITLSKRAVCQSWSAKMIPMRTILQSAQPFHSFTPLGRSTSSQEASAKDGSCSSASRSPSLARRCLHRKERVKEAGGRDPRCRTVGKGRRYGRPEQEGIDGRIQFRIVRMSPLTSIEFGLGLFCPSRWQLYPCLP